MQLQLHVLTIEDLVPQDHFVRKLEAALDLSFVREETYHLYNHKTGRPPIEPEVLVKYLLVGFLYGIPSERQIEERIRDSVPLRWYLGLDLFDPVPDHSTISQNRRRRPAFRKVFRRLFEEVVRQCVARGLASGRLVATDSSHMKANASRASEELVEVTEEAGAYWERLDRYEEEGLKELERRTGKRRGKRTKQVKKSARRTHKRVSRTDPEAGYMNRPGKPRGQHYLSHQTVDTDNGIILGVTVTAGDVNDAAPYLDHIEQIHREVIQIQAATADAAYDFPLAHRVMADNKIEFFVRPTERAVQEQTEFTYNKETDSYRCPEGKTLRLNTLRRSGGGLHWVYKAEKADCQGCPRRDTCLSASQRDKAKKIERNYFAPEMERDLSRQEEPEYRAALLQRQIWSEGTFAAQKWVHNLTRLLRRGQEAAEDHCLLSATAMNLKRMLRCLG